MPTLAEILAEQVREGDLWEALDGGRIRCYACGHCCPISEGQVGVCKVRFNRGGKLYVPWGYVGGVQCDPIEKKPFFHVRPGALAFSFGMLGCDLHCGYCQNWVTSQAIRDSHASVPPKITTPEQLVQLAVEWGAEAMVSTYNEPLITAEWAVAVFKEVRAAGMLTGFVSNGNATPRVLEYIRPWVDLYKVDLKSFDDRRYRQLGGRLQPILDSVKRIHEIGFWLEVVTLLVPGFNDSDQELQRLTEFLAGVSPDIPWHVTAFHKDYKMTDTENTSAATLVRAAEIGHRAGLHFVYAGNLQGQVGNLENTYCVICSELLIRRYGYRIVDYRITPEGRCPACFSSVPGRWAKSFRRQMTDHPLLPLLGKGSGPANPASVSR
jgi:pyruvate formate lyase activating enzyme